MRWLLAAVLALGAIAGVAGARVACGGWRWRAPVHAAVRRATEAPEANATAVGAARRLVDALAAREDDAYDARYRDLRYLADVCGPLAAEAVARG